MRCAMVGFGHEERARDLVGGQAAEQPQRQRDARVGREHGMARDEASGAADRRRSSSSSAASKSAAAIARADVLRRRAVVLAPSISSRRSAIDRAVLRRRHQPRARVVAGCPTPATARARRRAHPAPDPRPSPTSRTIRERARRSGCGDSMRQIASIALRVAAVARRPPRALRAASRRSLPLEFRRRSALPRSRSSGEKLRRTLPDRRPGESIT